MRGLDGSFRGSCPSEQNGLCAYGCLLFRFACAVHGFSEKAKCCISCSYISTSSTAEDRALIGPVEAANTFQRPNVNLTMPGTPTTTATLRDNRLFVQYRRRERVDANTTDTSTLARLPLDVISNALSYLPSRQLTNVVKNVNARYKELAMPLLTKRLFWLERELAHDMWELVSEYDYAGRRHYYQELARLCRTLNCRTYIEDPKTVLTS